jgi:hypothetical protein
MALDIHKLTDRAEDHLFSIGDNEYSALESAFNIYKKKTGIFIDPYSDTKFTCGIDVLISSIEESMKSNENNGVHKQLISILSQAINDKYCIIFVGD